jgi:hypothetical protein
MEYKNPARGQVLGIKSLLTVQQSLPCSGFSQSFAYNYVMLYSGGEAAWAQIGYYRDNGLETPSITEDLAQIKQDALPEDQVDYRTFIHLSAGTQRSYVAAYVVNGCSNGVTTFNCIELDYDGQELISTWFDPANNAPVWGYPWKLQYAEEGLYEGTNVAGTPTNPANFAAMQYKDSNNVYHTTDSTFLVYENDNPDHWAHSASSDYAKEFYTYNPYPG